MKNTKRLMFQNNSHTYVTIFQSLGISCREKKELLKINKIFRFYAENFSLLPWWQNPLEKKIPPENLIYKNNYTFNHTIIVDNQFTVVKFNFEIT